MIKDVLDTQEYHNNLPVNTFSFEFKPQEHHSSKPIVQTTKSNFSNASYQNPESLEDHVVELGEMTVSQQLNKAFIESGRTSRASLPQKEPFATESQQRKTDSFNQEINRFKKSFKKTFEGFSNASTGNENMNDEEIFRFHSKYPSQQFGLDSLAMKLQNEQTSVPREDNTSSMSIKSMEEKNDSESTEKGGHTRLFMIKKIFARPGLKKKQAMVLNQMSEIRNNNHADLITSNGENDYVQSLDTSYDNNVKEFQENFKLSKRNNKTFSCDVDREKYLKSDPKTQETYTNMPTEYSILKTQHIVEVLEHIEKQKTCLVHNFKPVKEFSKEKNFTVFIKQLNEKNKDNKKQQKPDSKNSSLRRVNISAHDLEPATFSPQQRGLYSHQNSGYQDRSISQASVLGVKENFVSKHNLSLDAYLDSQRRTDEDGQATEGSFTSRPFDAEIDLQDLNKTFINDNSITYPKEERKTKIRWQSQPRSRKFRDSQNQNHNQSCLLPQPESSDSFVHKARKHTPVVRPREKKLMGHIKSEFISVQDGEEVDSYSPQEKTSILKNTRKLSPYMIFSTKPEDNKRFSPVRRKKVNLRDMQLQRCYGESLKLNYQEKLKKKL